MANGASRGGRRRRRKPNKSGIIMNRLELVIFGAIIIYIFVLIYRYINTKPIKGYEIQMGSLSVSKTYTGIALRQEEILKTPYTGYICYHEREGSRVSSRDTVYSIDASGRLANMLNTGEDGDNVYTDEELSEFRSEIIQYGRSYNNKNFRSVYDFKYDVKGAVVKLVSLSISENIEALNQSRIGGMVSLCSAGQSGYIVYSTDGYEDLTPQDFSAALYDQTEYKKERINNNDLVNANVVVGKLVTSEEWSLIIPVDEERAAILEEKKVVKVKFIKTQETSWGEVTIHHLSDGIYAELAFNNSCVSFCTDRFIDIELVVDDKRGLKIPNSAIAEKECFIIPAEYMSKGGSNGNYGVLKEDYDEEGNVLNRFVETTVYSATDTEFYIESDNLKIGDYICKQDSADKMAVSKSGTLTGVYNMNKGYADFKQITVIAENDEYSIVSSNTQYGLTVYDRIVLDAASVKSDDFINP